MFTEWRDVGSTGPLLYGECQSSGKRFYKVVLDVEQQAWYCNCPSGKSPCKHCLNLLYKWVGGEVEERAEPATFVEAVLGELAEMPAAAPTPDAVADHTSAEDTEPVVAAQLPPTASAEDPAIWRDGELAARRAHLREVRRRDPAAGLALLTELDWKAEAKDAKVGFIRVLLNELSMLDEPFLEGCLRDRLKDVREEAVSLLERLPDSTLIKRAEQLATQYLSHVDGTLQTDGVPETTETKRDLYPTNRAGWPPVEDADRLEHVISLVPTSQWPQLLGATAIELALAPATRDGEPIDLTEAWEAAARNSDDQQLALALFEAHPDRIGAVAGQLPEDMVTDWQIESLRETQMLPVINHLAYRLDPAQTDALAEVMDEWVADADFTKYFLEELGALLVERAHPSRLDAIEQRLHGYLEVLRPTNIEARRGIEKSMAALEERRTQDS